MIGWSISSFPHAVDRGLEHRKWKIYYIPSRYVWVATTRDGYIEKCDPLLTGLKEALDQTLDDLGNISQYKLTYHQDWADDCHYQIYYVTDVSRWIAVDDVGNIRHSYVSARSLFDAIEEEFDEKNQPVCAG